MPTSQTLIRIKFIDLKNIALANLYHEVRVSGNRYAISAGKSNAEGYGVWIKQPVGTRLDILIRHPLTKELVSAKQYVRVPSQKGTFKVQAPFFIEKIQTKPHNGDNGDYRRKTHTVTAEDGDTLYSIAKQHNTTWQVLAQLNKDTIPNPDKLKIGDVVKLPPQNSGLRGTTNEPPNSLANQSTYTLKRGDTLWDISQRSGVSVGELQRINGISDPKTIQSGQTIRLRGQSSTSSPARRTTTPSSSGSSSSSSSNPSSASGSSSGGWFGSAVDGALDWVSDTASDVYEGAKSAGGAVLDAGEGAIDWAGDRVDDVVDWVTGDEPTKRVSGSAPKSQTATPPASSKDAQVYTVKPKDTLSGIASKYPGVSYQDIAKANNMRVTDTIRPGQQLMIPKAGGGTSSGSGGGSTRQAQPIQTRTVSGNSQANGTPKETMTTDGSCVCQTYDLIWGAKVSCEFRKKVVEICQDLWPNDYLNMANNLMAVFAWETGEKFHSGTPNRAITKERPYGSGATGLIQFMPDTYKALTGNEPQMEFVTNYWGRGEKLHRIKQLANMTEVEQLDLVRQYFEPKRNQKLEFIDFYLQVLFPASSGKPEHVVFADDISKLDLLDEKTSRKVERVEKFSSNNMDIDDDGKVMKSEIAKSTEHYLIDGEKLRNFGKCENPNVISKPTNNTGCINNTENCICQNIEINSKGIVTNPQVKQEIISAMKKSINDVKAIVLHRTAGSSALSSIQWGRKKGFGAHFYVDNDKGVDGQIYQSVSVNNAAYHMGVAQYTKTKQAGLGNYTTIGIEVAGLALDKNGKQTWSNVDRWEDLTEKQAKSTACLLVSLMNHFNLSYDKVHFHEDLCSKQAYEGRMVWISIKKYLPNPPKGNKPAPYRPSPVEYDERFPEE